MTLDYFKSYEPWDTGCNDEVCYIPENNDGTKGDIFTPQDFIDLCDGDWYKARHVFEMCSWQFPDTFIDGLDEEDERYFEESRKKRDNVYAAFLNIGDRVRISNFPLPFWDGSTKKNYAGRWCSIKAVSEEGYYLLEDCGPLFWARGDFIDYEPCSKCKPVDPTVYETLVENFPCGTTSLYNDLNGCIVCSDLLRATYLQELLEYCGHIGVHVEEILDGAARRYKVYCEG